MPDIEGQFSEELKRAQPEDLSALAARAAREAQRVEDVAALRKENEQLRAERDASKELLETVDAQRGAAVEEGEVRIAGLRNELNAQRERAEAVALALAEKDALIEQLRSQVVESNEKGAAFTWPENTKLLPEQRDHIMMFLQMGDIAGLDNFLDHLIRYDDKLPTMLKHRYFKDEVLKVYARHFRRKGSPARRGADTQPGTPNAATGATTMGFGPGAGRLGVIFIDIDNFKRLNDTKGHLAGDAALKRIAEVVGETLREADIKGRFGGEELEMAVEIENEADHFIVAEKIRKAIENTSIEYEGDTFGVTVSVGAAELPPIGADVQDEDPERRLELLIDRANWAMKYAKAHGKNKAVPEEVDEVRAWVAKAKQEEKEKEDKRALERAARQ